MLQLDGTAASAETGETLSKYMPQQIAWTGYFDDPDEVLAFQTNDMSDVGQLHMCFPAYPGTIEGKLYIFTTFVLEVKFYVIHCIALTHPCFPTYPGTIEDILDTLAEVAKRQQVNQKARRSLWQCVASHRESARER